MFQSKSKSQTQNTNTSPSAVQLKVTNPRHASKSMNTVSGQSKGPVQMQTDAEKRKAEEEKQRAYEAANSSGGPMSATSAF